LLRRFSFGRARLPAGPFAGPGDDRLAYRIWGLGPGRLGGGVSMFAAGPM